MRYWFALFFFEGWAFEMQAEKKGPKAGESLQAIKKRWLTNRAPCVAEGRCGSWCKFSERQYQVAARNRRSDYGNMGV
ncbi:hypothetical protein DSLASN_06490 [Desulfoluna limicola]|uniref:Secreted protein n=2 Tax=Desulfoluna limicola TaxID=2810562 RepID=A0ABN6F133_9BACT|nr:hypothetical protein DSLASN_06490 [Desulfoluna limicola]